MTCSTNTERNTIHSLQIFDSLCGTYSWPAETINCESLLENKYSKIKVVKEQKVILNKIENLRHGNNFEKP